MQAMLKNGAPRPPAVTNTRSYVICKERPWQTEFLGMGGSCQRTGTNVNRSSLPNAPGDDKARDRTALVWALDHQADAVSFWGLNGYHSICGNIEKPAAAFKKQSFKIRLGLISSCFCTAKPCDIDNHDLLQKHVMIGNATIRNSRPHNWVSLAATDFRENDDVPGKLRYIAASSSKQSPDPVPSSY
jgi:hypothetical protein